MMSLREYIQTTATEKGRDVDRDLEDFIFWVVVGWNGTVEGKSAETLSKAREKLAELDAILNNAET